MTGENSSRFESILSSFASAVIIFDASGKVEWVNYSAEQMFSMSSAQMIGKETSIVFDKKGEIFLEIERAVAEDVTIVNHDALLRPGRGIKPIPVVLTAHPLEDEGGVAVVLRDLSSLKSLERSSKLSERIAEIAALAAGIAHEVKNPLSGVRGAAQLLGDEVTDTGLKEYTDLIIRESDRIDRLIMELLSLNELGDIGKEPVNIYTVLDDTIKIEAAEIESKNISIFREFDPSLPPALGDRDRLAQIFLNLVKNGVEAAGDSGSVTLKTGLAWELPSGAPAGPHSKFIYIEVSDDGPGIEDEVMPYIFTPFFSKKGSGTGLGLATTLRLVQAHGGFLEISNRPGDGTGAVAKVYLPYKA